MFFETRKFMLTVSLCAMLAVNPVLADVPKEKESVGDAHTVYTEGIFEGRMDSGIAGVTYVNKAMDAAGNAAQKAEGHAAAAGTSALSAAKSAGEAAKSAKAANDALSGKVDIDQGDENANKVMVTDEDGTVYPGYVSPEMIQVGELKPQGGTGTGSDFIGTTGVLVSDGTSATAKIALINDGMIGSGVIHGGHIADYVIGPRHIADLAVRESHISMGVIHSGHIAEHEIYGGHITSGTITNYHITSSGYTGVLYGDASGNTNWGLIKSDHIADGAVTIDKTDGVVGIVPVGSENATTSYAKFWIEE